MELPASWELKEKRRDDGRIDVVGRDDAGSDYVALTTETDSITPEDVKRLAQGDREQTDAYQFTKRFTDEIELNRQRYEENMQKDYEEGMEKVMRGAYSSKGTPNTPSYTFRTTTIGFADVPAWRWRLAFGE